MNLPNIHRKESYAIIIAVMSNFEKCLPLHICCHGNILAVLEWVRTRESSSESESTRPESESESIRCEYESIGTESESESIGPESESESLSPDSAWTHESNNRKALYFNPTLIIFAELCLYR